MIYRHLFFKQITKYSISNQLIGVEFGGLEKSKYELHRIWTKSVYNQDVQRMNILIGNQKKSIFENF